MYIAYKVNQIHNGIQKLYRFPNGYGASVVRHRFSYGNEKGLWELAVIRWQKEGEGYGLDYDTELTSETLGYLTDDDVEYYLKKIEELS